MERTDVIGTDDDDLTIVGEHAVLAELRRRAARPFAPPAPAPLPPPTLPIVQPPPRPRTIQLDADDWWDDEDDSDGGGLVRWGLRLLAVIVVGGLGLFGLRSCGDDGTSVLPPVDGQSITVGAAPHTPSPACAGCM